MNTDTRLIPLTQGKFAVVDAIDYDYLMQWKWCASKRGYTYYAEHTEYVPKRKIWMHREVARRAGLPWSREYDHEDHDGLNNRRDNIRPSTRSQNNANTRKRPNTTSRFKGVYWYKRGRRWHAQINKGKDGKQKTSLGYFMNEQDAADAYAAAAKEKFGEFFCQQTIT